jgi:hypothetical protein
MRLVFAYKSAAVEVESDYSAVPKPSKSVIRLASSINASWVFPPDRMYLAAFYGTMRRLLLEDAARQSPVIGTLDQFVSFHTKSLAMSPVAGLNELLWQIHYAFAQFSPMCAEAMNHIAGATVCESLSWRFGIYGDD